MTETEIDALQAYCDFVKVNNCFPQFAHVMLAWKDEPNNVIEDYASFGTNDENNKNDEYVFYYFEDLLELFSAMNPKNKNFDFNIVRVLNFVK